MKKLLIVLTILASIAHSTAGEMKFLWSHSFQDGYLWDIEFMPDNDYFVLGYLDRIELRETGTGNLVKVDSVNARNIEISSDSSKFYVNNYGTFQVRDVNSFEVLQSVKLLDEIDGYPTYYADFCVDPVRQFLYIERAIEYDRDINTNPLFWLSICIYDAETLEFITELTTEDQKLMRFSKMDISSDGKYFALITEGKSKLLVWDLETREQIVDHYMAPHASNEKGEPGDLKFSRVNSDNIYITGRFRHFESDKDHQGLSVYNVFENKIVDERFNIEGNQIATARISFVENEEYVLSTHSYSTKILNLTDGKIEYSKANHYTYGWGGMQRVSKKTNKIIGFMANFFSAGYYDFDTSIEEQNKNEIIYPNPTTSIVTIPFICETSEASLSVFDSNGEDVTVLTELNYNGGDITVDLSRISAGVYIVRAACGATVADYKVVKEN